MNCLRYDFAIFSFLRLKCALENSLLLFSINVVFWTIYTFLFSEILELNFFEEILHIVEISIAIVLFFLKFYKYIEINCENNDRCKTYGGAIAYEKGARPVFYWFEPKSEGK
jgi:hypothetical protein